MKSILAIIIYFFSISLSGQGDPVLMTIDGQPVNLSEFVYIYEKNNGDDADYSKESVEEYLRLFTNFKLKVHKAKELKMDTIKSLQTELAGYRKQLATSYLMEKELTERLLKEMYERRKEDINISHILIRTRRNPGEKEVEMALERAYELYDSIQNGASFEALAVSESDDKTTAVNNGNIGWITSWLPSGFYNLENAAYQTPVGSVSKPVVSRLGVHIVKVNDRRPAYGKIEVAHILVRHDSDQTEDPEERIQKIYSLVMKDTPFENVAQTMSEDKSNAQMGGKLKPFGINTFDRNFEEAAFSLENDGDISEPVETKVGWHIIKRLSKPVETYEEFKSRMKSELVKLDRYNMIQDILVEEIKESENFQYNRELLNEFAENLSDDFFTYQWSVPDNISDENLIDFGDAGNYTLKAFAHYLKSNAKSRMKYSNERSAPNAVELIFKEYIKEIAMDHYENSLEDKYPDFKALMREYSDGILLFEISKEKVWDKASADTAGLRKFYNQNRNNYVKPTSALVSIYTLPGSQPELVKKIYEFAQENSAEETKSRFNQSGEVLIVEQKEIPVDRLEANDLTNREGSISGLLNNAKNNLTTFKKVEKIIPMSIKPLNESRGYVIADYQQYLEEKWIESLRNEYKVKYRDDVLDEIIK